MAYRKKTWHEKLADKKELPKILKLEKAFHAVHKKRSEAGDEIGLWQYLSRIPARSGRGEVTSRA
jgi:hypothetical protein